MAKRFICFPVVVLLVFSAHSPLGRQRHAGVHAGGFQIRTLLVRSSIAIRSATAVATQAGALAVATEVHSFASGSV